MFIMSRSNTGLLPAKNVGGRNKAIRSPIFCFYRSRKKGFHTSRVAVSPLVEPLAKNPQTFYIIIKFLMSHFKSDYDVRNLIVMREVRGLLLDCLLSGIGQDKL